jgi:hypothetical protein
MTQPIHSILPTWTPEREARALRLYLREGLSAAEVADALGCGVSRAAVIGKIRRLGFLKRDYAGRTARTVAAVICRPRVDRRLPPQRPPLPIDDPGPGRMHTTLFCAGPAPDGVYCAAHRALAHAR